MRPNPRHALPLTALLLAASVQAGPINLGLDPSLNLLAFGNMNVSSSDVQGRVAVGGNANISGYSINRVNGSGALHAGAGLTVGGNLNFSSGTIWGGVQVGGHYTPSSSGTVKGGIEQGTAFDFTGELTRLNQLSQGWDALANTGSVTDQWGTLHFNAAGQTLAVFDISAADLLKNLQIDALASDAQVLINVHGSSVDFGNHGYTGFNKSQVIFNLVDATSVLLNGGINGSLLATNATVNPGWGQINGQVVVRNWNTSMQVNDAPLPGTPVPSPRPQTPTAQALPEPGSLLLAALGLLTALLAGARRARPAATAAVRTRDTHAR